MGESLLQSFIEKYNKDREAMYSRFELLDRKIDHIGDKIEYAREQMVRLDKKLQDIEDVQTLTFGKLGARLENVKVYLSTIEDKLSEYETLTVQGQKVINGQLYLLKIKLQKIKPIVHWENDRLLSGKYDELEGKFRELEENLESRTD